MFSRSDSLVVSFALWRWGSLFAATFGFDTRLVSLSDPPMAFKGVNRGSQQLFSTMFVGNLHHEDEPNGSFNHGRDSGAQGTQRRPEAADGPGRGHLPGQPGLDADGPGQRA